MLIGCNMGQRNGLGSLVVSYLFAHLTLYIGSNLSFWHYVSVSQGLWLTGIHLDTDVIRHAINVIVRLHGKQMVSSHQCILLNKLNIHTSMGNMYVLFSYVQMLWAPNCVQSQTAGPVFSYKLRYIVGFGLIEMAISTDPRPTIYRSLYENTASSTNPKSTIYRNLYKNTSPGKIDVLDVSTSFCQWPAAGAYGNWMW